MGQATVSRLHHHQIPPSGIFYKIADQYAVEYTRPIAQLFSTAIPRFRLRLRKNYSTYTPYMLHNFYFVSLEI